MRTYLSCVRITPVGSALLMDGLVKMFANGQSGDSRESQYADGNWPENVVGRHRNDLIALNSRA